MDKIDKYEKGFYPLSKGISLAFERIHEREGMENDDPPTANEKDAIKTADFVYINLRTIYRSLHGSLTDGDMKITPKEMAELLEEEVSNLAILFARVFTIQAEPVFYFPSYASLRTYLPRTRLKNLEATANQERRLALEKATYAEFGKINNVTVYEFDCEISPVSGSPKVLMLTHMPVDLLSAHNFGEVHLFESNTGRVKPKSKFSQKLNKNKTESVFLPFNRMTLSIFGDGNKLVKPYAPTPKKDVLSIAKKYKWTSLTTNDRVLRCLNEELKSGGSNSDNSQNTDPMFVNELIKIMRGMK